MLSRRSFLKKALSFLFFWIAIPSGFYYYAREIEPTLLTIHKHPIRSPKIDASFDQCKIVHFSDTHVGFQYSIPQLNDLVTQINAVNPDIICFTGDLVDNPYTFNKFEEVTKALRNLQATYGKYWVYGNHDHGGYGTEQMKETMVAAQFTLLQNESISIHKGDAHIHIAGLDDAILGKPHIEDALQHIKDDAFVCLLAHEPDIVDTVKNHAVDMQLSGHSHGGQIRLPFIGPLITPRMARNYVDGSYQFDNHPMQLFVSRGIGTTRLPFRLFCRPEFNVYTLHHTNDE
ncbi:MAG TPA: metallophosphoesterase [Bacillota bacterium]|nr:metallophosphoesterase [Bacillota bacterium]